MWKPYTLNESVRPPIEQHEQFDTWEEAMRAAFEK